MIQGLTMLNGYIGVRLDLFGACPLLLALSKEDSQADAVLYTLYEIAGPCNCYQCNMVSPKLVPNLC